MSRLGSGEGGAVDLSVAYEDDAATLLIQPEGVDGRQVTQRVLAQEHAIFLADHDHAFIALVQDVEVG